MPRSSQIDTLPWYQYGWVWIIFCIPATAIVMGVAMIYLAISTNNSLVVDDYYKDGKAINVRIERDRMAAKLGLQVTLWQQAEGAVAQIQSAATDFQPPEFLTLRWVHVTQAARDGATEMHHLGGGRYLAEDVQLPESDRWRVHVQPAQDDASWRLVSNLTILQPTVSVKIGYRQDIQTL